MLVGNWMNTKPVTVSPETSMMRASKLMKDTKSQGLCVVEEGGRLVGIVTDRDIKEASPSKATTLDVHELYYLLSEITIKDIMTTKLLTVHTNESVEKAALMLQKHQIGALPVLDDEEKLVGILSQSDVFDVLIRITGVQHGGFQFSIDLEDIPGTMAELVDFLNKRHARIMSILTAYEPEEIKYRKVFVRIQDMSHSEQEKLLSELGEKYHIRYTLKENLSDLL